MAAAVRPMSQFFECPICLEESETPKILSCHHWICFKCASSLLSQSQAAQSNLIACPQCREQTTVPEGDADKLPNDFRTMQLRNALAATTRICKNTVSVSATTICNSAEPMRPKQPPRPSQLPRPDQPPQAPGPDASPQPPRAVAPSPPPRPDASSQPARPDAHSPPLRPEVPSPPPHTEQIPTASNVENAVIISCVNDSNEAGFKCQDCGMFMCNDCQSHHKERRLFADHTVLALDKVVCIKHSSDYVYFCQKCPRLLCKFCALTECVDHEEEIAMISKVAPFAREELDVLISSIENSVQTVNEDVIPSLKEVDEQIAATLEMHKVVTSHCKGLMDKLKSHIDGLTQTGRARYQTLIDIRTMLRIQNSGKLPEFLQTAKEAKSKCPEEILITLNLIKSALPPPLEGNYKSELLKTVRFIPEDNLNAGEIKPVHLDEVMNIKFELVETSLKLENIDTSAYFKKARGLEDLSREDLNRFNTPRWECRNCFLENGCSDTQCLFCDALKPGCCKSEPSSTILGGLTLEPPADFTDTPPEKTLVQVSNEVTPESPSAAVREFLSATSLKSSTPDVVQQTNDVSCLSESAALERMSSGRRSKQYVPMPRSWKCIACCTKNKAENTSCIK